MECIKQAFSAVCPNLQTTWPIYMFKNSKTITFYASDNKSGMLNQLNRVIFHKQPDPLLFSEWVWLARLVVALLKSLPCPSPCHASVLMRMSSPHNDRMDRARVVSPSQTLSGGRGSGYVRLGLGQTRVKARQGPASSF